MHTDTEKSGRFTVRRKQTQDELPAHRAERIQQTLADRTDQEAEHLQAATKQNYGWFELMTGTNGQG